PEQISLEQNYPNPFNPSTTIEIRLPVQSDFTLTIFDILGRKVRSFEYQRVPAGTHKVVWDGRDERGWKSASGVYICRLHAGQSTQTQRMLLLK
ncbi:MAG: T9SS type A sorting domain-containing protein, partial [Bacteroidota bacterium]